MWAAKFVATTLQHLKAFHPKQKQFRVKEIERVTGELIYIAGTTPWLKFMLLHVYISVASALGKNKSHLVITSNQFWQLLKDAQSKEATAKEQSFAQAGTARQVYSCNKSHWINKTLREELHLIIKVLSSQRLRLRSPIGHLVRHDPSGRARSDSCLRMAGGFSVDMGFWWYIEWPEEV